LIIVEKDKKTIKLYSNYIVNPNHFIEAKISDNQTIKSICSRNSIQSSLSSINFYLILEDLSFKKVTITANYINYASPKLEDEVNIFNEKFLTEPSFHSNSNFNLLS
jgi:hypothetical protein